MTKQQITPSTYQQAVLDWVSNGKGSAIIIAVAGSGKTATIEMALSRIPEHAKVQLFAFNSSIAKELSARVATLRDEGTRQYRNVRASTFHSVGFGAICRHLNVKANQVNTDGNKLRKLCDAWLGDLDAAMYGDFICKLVDFAKGEGIGVLVPNTAEHWYRLIQFHDIFLDSEEATEIRAIELAQDLLERSNKAGAAAFIDFSDMLYLPLLWKLRLFQQDWILVDEAQDSNPVRRALAKVSLRPGGRSVWVGDPDQSLYTFTGASHDAMDIIEREFNCVKMPLSVCYRCAKAIVVKAQEIVPHIEWHAGAAEGEVVTLPLDKALAALDAHDAILCRKNAPLISLAFRLIGEGRACVVRGRDIGVGLVSMIRKAKARDVDHLMERLFALRDREVAKFTARSEDAKADAMVDRVACIEAIVENLEEDGRTIPALIAKIDGMFRDTNGVLTLSSIHKSKGLEWRQVAVLEPENMPSAWARTDWQIKSEYCAMYVCWTRAAERLIMVQS